MLILSLIAAVGVALRFHAFFQGRSLWLDESMLAVNFMERSFVELLTNSLDNGQIAPPGFLAITKVLVDFFGINLFTIRFLPISSGVATVVLAFMITLKGFRSDVARYSFLTMVSVSPVLIYYSVEFKPYSLDVLSVMFFILLSGIKITIERAKWLAPVIFVLVLSSLISIPVSAIWVLIEIAKRARRHGKSLTETARVLCVRYRFIVLTWLLASGLHVLHLLSTGERTPMVRFWSRAGGFPNEKTQTVGDFLWYPKRFLGYIADPFINQQIGIPRSDWGPVAIVAVATILMAFGFWSVREKTVASFAVSVLVVPLALAELNIYPAVGRLTLFTIGATIFLVALGIDHALTTAGPWASPLWISSLILLLGNPTLASLEHAMSPNDSKDTAWALEEVQRQIASDEVLLVDSYNKEQVSFHQFLGFGETIETEGFSAAKASFSSDWGPLNSGYWIISTHAPGQYELQREGLIARGYVEVCFGGKETTSISRFRISSEAEGYDCEFGR
ncbi:hypothetical protein N8964_00755 [Pontimonas sp.]|nr:hypothetical protein [Pontimonas sp.]